MSLFWGQSRPAACGERAWPGEHLSQARPPLGPHRSGGSGVSNGIPTPSSQIDDPRMVAEASKINFGLGLPKTA